MIDLNLLFLTIGRESFSKYLVSILSNNSLSTIDTASIQLRRALEANNLEKFCQILETLFAHIPYQIVKEDYYHALLQFLLTLLSFKAQSEIPTNKGRIDMTLEIKQHIFVFELKYNATPEKALEQIKKRGYFEKYLNLNKKITLVELAFQPEEGAIHLRFIKEEIH